MQGQKSLTVMLAVAHAMAAHTGLARPLFSVNQHGGRLVISGRSRKTAARVGGRRGGGVASPEQCPVLSDGRWWSCSRDRGGGGGGGGVWLWCVCASWTLGSQSAARGCRDCRADREKRARLSTGCPRSQRTKRGTEAWRLRGSQTAPLRGSSLGISPAQKHRFRVPRTPGSKPKRKKTENANFCSRRSRQKVTRVEEGPGK